MRRSRRAGLAAAAVAISAVAFAVGAWVVVPLAVGNALDAWAAAAPSRTATVRRVSVNPFLLRVSLHDVMLEAAAASVVADRVALDFGIASLLRPVAVLDALEIEAPRLRLGAGGPERAGDGSAWAHFVPQARFAITRTTVSAGSIELAADGGAPLVLDGVSLTASGIDNATDARAPFEIDIRDALGGVLRLEGDLVLAAAVADGRVIFENVDAGPVAARLFASPSIAGSASGSADFEWRDADGSLLLRNGALRLLRPEIDWRSGGAVAAASLEATGDAELRGGAWRAAIDTIEISSPRTTVLLNAGAGEAGNRPLDAVLEMLSAPHTRTGPGAARGDAAREANVLAVRRILLDGGVLEIVDAGLEGARPSFSVSSVGGAIERAGDGETIVADLAARIGVEGSATLRVRRPGGGADGRAVALELRGMPADAIAAHALRFAGYALEGGVVDAEIDYRVEAGGVDGNARVAVRGVDIERLEEDVDGHAYVPYALALLEDANGGAETAFGFTSPDAEAGIGRIVAAGVLAQLEAVAAAPFAALAAPAGIDAAALEAVSFPPGEAAPSEPETIDALAEALLARPRVGLRVQGVADRELDRDALAAQQVELHVALATAGPTGVARPQPVDFASPRHRDILDEFAGERLGAEQRETIASYFSRTPDGRIVEAERDAYYRALFDALVENETIPENGIERLGRYRARAIANALTAQGVPEARVEIAPDVLRVASADRTASPAARSADAGGGRSDEPSDGRGDEPGGDEAPVDAFAPRIEAPLEVFVLPSGTTVAEPDAASAPPADAPPAGSAAAPE